MTTDVRVYLAHILECVDKIERFTAEGRDRFMRDPMVQDAVIRGLVDGRPRRGQTGLSSRWISSSARNSAGPRTGMREASDVRWTSPETRMARADEARAMR